MKSASAPTEKASDRESSPPARRVVDAAGRVDVGAREKRVEALPSDPMLEGRLAGLPVEGLESPAVVARPDQIDEIARDLRQMPGCIARTVIHDEGAGPAWAPTRRPSATALPTANR